MSEHNLKTIQPFFNDVLHGRKTFEVRKYDRNFSVGDTLTLEEFDPFEGYTGQAIVREITYMLDSPEYCKPGYVVLGINNPTDAQRLVLTASIPIDRLEVIADAEQEGRVVVLELPESDTMLYEISGGEVYEHSVDSIEISTHELDEDGEETGQYGYFSPDDFGKTVFLTRAEALAALAGADGEARG